MNRTTIVLLILCIATAIIGSAAEAPVSTRTDHARVHGNGSRL